jgi:hypothetical protein
MHGLRTRSFEYTRTNHFSIFDFKLKFLQYATRGKIARSEWKDELYDKLTKPLQDKMHIEVQKIQDFTEFADLTSGTDARLKRDRARNFPPLATKAAQTRVRTTLGHPIESISRQLTQLVRTSATPAPPPRQYSATLSRPKQFTLDSRTSQKVVVYSARLQV